MTQSDKRKLLIVGGSGQVGRVIAEQLARSFPDRVIIAGRNLDRARDAARKLGPGVDARAFDIRSNDVNTSLDQVALVVVCLDQDDDRFVRRCLMRGIHYVDITAHHAFLLQAERLDGVAKQSDATAVVSVGVEPGLTNLLAAHAAKQLAHVDRMDILVEIGLGDHHGRAAIEWMLDNLDAEFEIRENGRRRVVKSLDESMSFTLPDEPRARVAYRFNFPDQHVLGESLGVETVSSWLCLSSPTATSMLAKLSRPGLASRLRSGWMREAILGSFARVHVGSDRCLVAVRATDESTSGGREITVSVSGRREADMTATVAVETVRQLLCEDFAPGVFHIEQVVALEPVLDALRANVRDVSSYLAPRDFLPPRA